MQICFGRAKSDDVILLYHGSYRVNSDTDFVQKYTAVQIAADEIRTKPSKRNLNRLFSEKLK